MKHILPALVIQAALSLLSDWWVGAAAASFFYIGREITQAEYRNIEGRGGKRADMPWYGGFEVRAWNSKSVLDWLMPTSAVCTLAFLISL